MRIVTCMEAAKSITSSADLKGQSNKSVHAKNNHLHAEVHHHHEKSLSLAWGGFLGLGRGILFERGHHADLRKRSCIT